MYMCGGIPVFIDIHLGRVITITKSYGSTLVHFNSIGSCFSGVGLAALRKHTYSGQAHRHGKNYSFHIL